jgi:hypothetical protein
MESDLSTGLAGDRPQWLGSLVRRGEQQAAQAGAATFDEERGGRWLGSVARRNAEHGVAPAPTAERDEPTALEQAAAAWRGSSVRSAVFSAPRMVSTPDPLPASAPALHELNGHGRMVMGELGMALRVAA